MTCLRCLLHSVITIFCNTPRGGVDYGGCQIVAAASCRNSDVAVSFTLAESTPKPHDRLTAKEQDMAQKYDPVTVESKWQRHWAEEGIYQADLWNADARHNFISLTPFPCPDEDAHAGHLYMYIGHDVNARYKHARGYNVFFPFGLNSFGFGLEDAAQRRGVHPRELAEFYIERLTEVVSRLGPMIDWRSTSATHRPEVFKWDQWFFLKMLAHKLASRALRPADWCPSCLTTLAREQVKGEERVCAWCETPVVKKTIHQWKLRMKAYAGELLKGLADVDWP